MELSSEEIIKDIMENSGYSRNTCRKDLKEENKEEYIPGFLRQSDDVKARNSYREIKVSRGLTKEEFEILLNDVFRFIDFNKKIYKSTEYYKGIRDAIYFIGDAFKCNILCNEIETSIDIKKYIDEILNLNKEIKKEDIVECPQCQGKLIIMKDNNGEEYYKCENCKYVSYIIKK